MIDIKFEMYCNSKMYSHSECLINGFDPRTTNSIDGYHCYWRQYTGLKDKNGKEIYEGDILMSVPFTGCYHPNKQVVDYYGMSFVFRGLTKDASPHTDYTVGSITNSEMKIIEEVEIIGNIHENPELL